MSSNRLEREVPAHPPPHTPILDDDEVDWHSLEKYLKELLEADSRKDGNQKSILSDTEFRRMVRIYDLLRYRALYLEK